MRSINSRILPISKRPVPDQDAWQFQKLYLATAQVNKSSRKSYQTALQIFADWLQSQAVAGYAMSDSWPLSPNKIDTKAILEFHKWLDSSKAQATRDLYTGVVMGYLNFLDTQDELPPNVQLGKLRQSLSEIKNNVRYKNKIDSATIREGLVEIVNYYDNQELSTGEDKRKKQIVLLRNRAITQTLYSTGIGVSDLVLLNKKDVDFGKATFLSLDNSDKHPVRLPLSIGAQKALQAYLSERKDENLALFVSHDHQSYGMRLSTASVHNIIKAAVKHLGLHGSITTQHFRTAKEARLDSHQEIIITVPTEVDRIFKSIKALIKTSKLSKEFREVSLNDLEEARTSFGSGAFKACIVLLGSVLEAIMLGTLMRPDVLTTLQDAKNPPEALQKLGVKHPSFSERIAERLGFEDYKNVIHQLIPEIEKLKVDSIQSFRNTIHPWLSIKNPTMFGDKSRTNTRTIHFIASLEILAHKILSWNPSKT